MTEKDPSPRLARLRREQITPEMQAMFDLFAGSTDLNIEDNHVLNTLAQHPQLAAQYLPFNHYLLRESSLPVRLRQIAILRLSWRINATYQWSSHLRTSLRNGLNPDDFECVKGANNSHHWTAQERTILRATDELIDHHALSDDAWAALNEFLTTREILDFLFTVGAYQLLGGVLNSVRVDREEELLQLAAQFGAPPTAIPSSP
ncbi:carboxymuconolactone decarboxylase family protein [Aestuariicella hydrocarbonica]|uniref:Carboxymuconolactone decarboxylase family protein n=1 Tax=Pseudomaricurvus hydrocarbonicus TaxID=1470433 RepID=A0A9E5JW67_9GAMM|nr:carboxymuconolactone decarboxylase family protein [Aestuariicella hydrocarbonica]NHO65995.1 carboxymuconolactone decarboxylase family protein [Aestuariicella hydrocarbonica]